MSLHPKIQLSRLRAIGWDLWDPIGIRGLGDDWQTNAADEYDRYLLKAVSLLSHGNPVADVASYFENIASNHMGLGPTTPEGKDAAFKTAEAIANYLRSLPDAPEAVKP